MEGFCLLFGKASKLFRKRFAQAMCQKRYISALTDSQRKRISPT